jgi:hypothetical protein
MCSTGCLPVGPVVIIGRLTCGVGTCRPGPPRPEAGARAGPTGEIVTQPLDLAAELGLQLEPPIGIEPMTYSLRVNRSAD